MFSQKQQFEESLEEDNVTVDLDQISDIYPQNFNNNLKQKYNPTQFEVTSPVITKAVSNPSNSSTSVIVDNLLQSYCQKHVFHIILEYNNEFPKTNSWNNFSASSSLRIVKWCYSFKA